ncbi:MAG: Rap1a/Tai family immunity protein [Thiobacillus sp.]
MKIVFVTLLLFAFSSPAYSQLPVTSGGNWIKEGVDAFDRVHVTRNGTIEDVQNSSMLLSFVFGMIAVHRQNNLLATLLISASSPSNSNKYAEGMSPETTARVKTALAFVPLIAIPDTLTSAQIVAVLRKYLDSNPEQWNKNAPHLITEALKASFEKQAPH